MPIFVAQMSMSLLIKPIMAEDALFAFIPGYPVRRGSRRPECISDRVGAVAACHASMAS